MMKSSSFESPKPYLLGNYLKNSIPALLRYVILAQSHPILLHTEGNGWIFFWLAVHFDNCYTMMRGLFLKKFETCNILSDIAIVTIENIPV